MKLSNVIDSNHFDLHVQFNIGELFWINLDKKLFFSIKYQFSPKSYNILLNKLEKLINSQIGNQLWNDSIIPTSFI